jgi:cytochrome P450
MSPEAIARLAANRKGEGSVALEIDEYASHRRHLAAHRIAFDERRCAWAVFRYADVQQVMLDTENFSSERTLRPDGSVDELLGAGMLSTDPPRHRHLRSLAALAFTQKRVAQLESRIRDITTKLLDDFHGRESVDIIEALAFPLPVTVIGELLGLPPSDNEMFHRWAERFISNEPAVRSATAQEIAAYFDGLVVERTVRPGPDLISELSHVSADGTGLTRAEVVGMCLLLLIAGHETTMSLLGNALWCLEENPNAQAELAAQPELIPGAIEEVLRYRGVVHYFARAVKRPVRFLGQDLVPGDLVLPMFAAANLDASQFPDPDRFDIRRTPNKHLGFGYGIHLCLGAGLARLEAKIALTELLARYPKIRRDLSEPLELRRSTIVYSLRRYLARPNG